MYATMIPDVNRVHPGDVVTYTLKIANNEGHQITVGIVSHAPSGSLFGTRATTVAVAGGVTGASAFSGEISDSIVMPADSIATYTIVDTLLSSAPVGTRLYPEVVLTWTSTHPSCVANTVQVHPMQLFVEPAALELADFAQRGACNCN